MRFSTFRQKDCQPIRLETRERNKAVLQDWETSRLAGKKVALVGGAGFIGHHLALKLLALGAEPHVVDGLQVNNLGYYSSGYLTDINGERYLSFIDERLALLRAGKIPLHVIDARDYSTVTNTLKSIEPDVIVHLAAVAHANRSNKDPFSTFDHSLRTLENVLDANRSLNAQVVYFSSSMVYGNFDGKPAEENQPCNPIGIYGALKYAAEKLLIGYHQVFDTPYTIIRPSALYGERCVSRRVGQSFIENAMDGLPLSIMGDGSDSLDFTYVQDLVSGTLKTLLNPQAGGEIFNLTFGSGRTINNLVDVIASRFENTRVTRKSRDSLMPERGSLSISKAKDLLGYSPQFDLEAGFNEYIDWYLNAPTGEFSALGNQ